jgi:two-component system, cell cycle sensor histidine kinase and response regulator CckA
VKPTWNHSASHPCWISPIFRDGQVIGVVCHEHLGPPREWTVEERDFTASVADAIASKFESATRQDVELSRRALELHTAELHRLDAVSRVAAGIAHDFKNVLLVILCNADLIRQADTTPSIIAMAQQILEAAERGKALSDELLNFGQEQSHRTSAIQVADVVQRFVGILQTAVGRAYSIHFIRGASPGRVFMEPSQLERVLLNLCLNARDAMPPGGIITITVHETRVTEALGAPGVYTVVEVRDTGAGMDAKTKARIFEPLFTTKTKDKGNGLGLTIVHRIVDRAGGFIHVMSEPGQGTCMRVYLPRVSSET